MHGRIFGYILFGLLAILSTVTLVTFAYCKITDKCELRIVNRRDISRQLHEVQKYEEPNSIIPPDSVLYRPDRKI